MLRLLFEDLAEKHFSSARVQKLKSWVEHADSARKSGNLDEFANQYDKAEELITFYTFAPMLLRDNKQDLVNEILRLANLKANVGGVVSVDLERLLQPPLGYLAWMQDQVINHPIKYMREQAQSHRNGHKPLETATHVDAFIKTDNLVILVEMKFTSDISIDTTFNPYRNQLARLIDVGIEKAIEEGKKLIVLLATPSGFFRNRSRLYFYKIQDYINTTKIHRDIVWRKQEDIERHVLAVKWVPLEELIKILYKDFIHPEREEAMEFFRERKLA